MANSLRAFIAGFGLALASCAGDVSSSAHSEETGSTDDGGFGNDAGAVAPDAGAPPDAGPGEFDAGFSCTPAQTPSSDSHSPDYDCMSAGCHGPDTAVAGLLITVSGTLHSTPTGGAPVAGASVFVKDSLGKTLQLITSATGIFWSGVSDGGVVPAGPQGTCAGGSCSSYAALGALQSIVVGLCPSDDQTCASPSSGECANCHSYGTGAQQSVHLP